MLKDLSNLAGLMRSASELRRKMDEVTNELKAKRVLGSSGGGMVEVEANGLGDVLAVRLDAKLVERGEREMLEDLLPAAINNALAKSKEMHMELAKSATEGLSLPGLNEALSKIIPK